MRHQRKRHKLSRDAAHRRALLANLSKEVIEHERITTTEAKAKAVKPELEKLITLAKRGDLHARRQALCDARPGQVRSCTSCSRRSRRATRRARAATRGSSSSGRAPATRPRWSCSSWSEAGWAPPTRARAPRRRAASHPGRGRPPGLSIDLACGRADTDRAGHSVGRERAALGATATRQRAGAPVRRVVELRPTGAPNPYRAADVEAGPVTKLTLAYDGTEFAGWARQPGLRTVQEELERAIAQILGEPLAAQRRRTHRSRRARVGPGRELPPRGARPAAAQRAAARRRRRARERAGGRRLRRAPQRPQPHLLLPACWRRRRARRSSGAARCGCRGASTAPRSRPARRRSSGTHDFTAFTPTETDHVRFERDVLAARWEERDGVLEFWIEADSFMRQMNRVLVGTMLEVARGRRSLEDFASLLAGRPRARRRPDGRPARALPRRRVVRLTRPRPSISWVGAQRPADQRRRDRGRRPAGAAALARRAGRRSASW